MKKMFLENYSHVIFVSLLLTFMIEGTCHVTTECINLFIVYSYVVTFSLPVDFNDVNKVSFFKCKTFLKKKTLIAHDNRLFED